MKRKPQTEKRTIYLGDDLLQEIEREAKAQGRSVSWLLRAAWTIAREPIQRLRGRAQ